MNDHPIAIRDAQLGDLPALLALYQSSGLDEPQPMSATALAQVEQAWLQLQAMPLARVRVAQAGERLVGTLTLFILPMLSHQGTPSAVIESVGVAADLQGLGLGRALVEDAMALAAAAGCYKLALSSNLRRAQAHAFYEQLGFAQHGKSFQIEMKT
ncbi:GNAT family N-acetyltransferase [Roseateles oligotrophus]|uniref:GNAT family N-acetyltransferase n=1 Tax=Roseateles oligotrophus TaxID=1769250 RepID=A0ABT2YC21_9BURK|nr:GNAT family N-acetyltransferase [Roseateles oligotrophus]MCV2367595.1 GNAT family N-acetyltransferase [Roseateles oligotrophus]